MSAPAWKLELLALLHRYPETGLQHDVPLMSEQDQYAALAAKSHLYRYLEHPQTA